MKKGILSVFLFIVLCLAGCNNNAASIGIIGGADGPTAIFVTSSTNQLNLYSFIGVIVIAIWVVFIYYRNKKKK